MVQQGSDRLSNQVLHFGNTLCGTRQFWHKQKNRLTAMIDTLALPTVFFILSAADLQWPELADLLNVPDTNDRTASSTAVVSNPCMANWFFYHCVMRFMDVYFQNILKTIDYWLRFEYQHRGSPRTHGVAWLRDAPVVENVLASDDPSTHEAHICNKPYGEIENHSEDLNELIATCQRHTRCSTAYFLRTNDGMQKCCFNFPKPLQAETEIIRDEETDDPILLTARNDGLINSYNPIQLSAWRGNVDMQYCVSKYREIEYITKYAAKCEPRSQTMKEVYSNIVQNLNDNTSALQVVHKLLTNTVAERDFTAQETCHLLLQLPLVKSTRDHVALSLDGSRQVQEEQPQDTTSRATAPSILDHYIQQTSLFKI